MITLYDVASKMVTSVLNGHTGGISSLAFSADGTLIVSGSYDKTVKLWQAASGKELVELKAPEAIHSVAISPDGRFIVAATGNEYIGDDEQMAPSPGGTVMVWNVDTRTELAALPGTRGFRAGRRVFSRRQDFRLSGPRWSGHALGHTDHGPRAILQGHRGYIYSLAFAPDGKTLASSCIDSTVRLWNVAELLAPRADQEQPGR